MITNPFTDIGSAERNAWDRLAREGWDLDENAQAIIEAIVREMEPLIEKAHQEGKNEGIAENQTRFDEVAAENEYLAKALEKIRADLQDSLTVRIIKRVDEALEDDDS